jgi:hypothetical protein
VLSPTSSFTVTPTFTISDTPQPTPTADVPAVLDQNVFRPGRGRPLIISMKAPEPGHVTVKIYDVAGELVRTPFDAEVSAGLWFQATWQGENDFGEKVASGVYIVSVRGGGIRSIRKVVLLK